MQQQQFSNPISFPNQGMPSSEAATKAFGDLKALNKEMNKRLSGSSFPAYKLSNDRLPKPEVSLRPLRPGEKAMIALRMRSDRGVNRETAQPILAEATPIAAKYADDPVVQGWFAEMVKLCVTFPIYDSFLRTFPGKNPPGWTLSQWTMPSRHETIPENGTASFLYRKKITRIRAAPIECRPQF